MKRISSYKSELLFIFSCSFIIPFFYLIVYGIQSKNSGVIAISIPIALLPGALSYFLYRVERIFYFDTLYSRIIVKKIFGKKIVEELTPNTIQSFKSSGLIVRKVEFFTVENKRLTCYVGLGKYRILRRFLDEINTLK